MRIRLFLTCWVLFCLHFATDFVREHYLVVSMVEDGSFDLGKYYGLHEDIFRNPPNAPRAGVHHGANPGISMLAAIPYFALRPVVDRIVARNLVARKASGADTLAIYNDPREARVRFYREARRLGLDVRFGLVGIITMVLCMAPLSALGVVALFTLLRGAGLSDRLALGGSLLYAFATPVLFRSAYLNQNLAIGVVALVAFLLLWNPGERLRGSEPTRTVLAGACAGFGFLCDYSGALSLGILGLYTLARARDRYPWSGVIRQGLLYTAGALPMIVLLWWYQFASFGNFILPPQNWMPAVIFSDAGYQGVTGPQLDLFIMLLADPRFGLFVAAPLLILALGAPFLAWKKRSFIPTRELIVCFAIAAAYIVFFSSVNYTRLQWNSGIRYLVPVVPFLFLAAAVTLIRLPRAVAYGIVLMAVTVSWSLAMVRSQYGIATNVVHVFIEGLQLPWLNTLGKMSAQYAPWLSGRPSAVPAMLLAGAVVTGIWMIKSPWKPITSVGYSPRPVTPELHRMPVYQPTKVGGWDQSLLVDVVIPVLNEAHVLAESVATVRQFLAQSLPCRWRVVVVDNGSTDGTDAVALELAARFDDVRFLQLPQRGRGRALRHAWSQSDADVMCYTDVDLSTELAALPKLVQSIVRDDFDVATGSRLLPGSRTTRSPKREFISRCYNIFVKAVLWTSFSDAQCGFKAIGRRAMVDLVPDVEDQSWFFDTELLVLAEKRGYRIADIPVQWIEDDDSRVKIATTAWDDIKGVFRVRWKLWHEALSPGATPARALSKRAAP
jgi:hypothetical protein